MTTLIIPDVHDRINTVQRIIQGEPHDHRVYVGDFLDSWLYQFEPEASRQAQRTAEFLKRELYDPKTTILLGNHDLSYWYGYLWGEHRCSGFTQAKSWAIRQVLSEKDWSLFRLHYWIGEERPWLVTHAGFHRKWIRKEFDTRDQIDSLLNAALWNLKSPNAGKGLGIISDDEGVLWCRHNQLIPPMDLNQVYGHTPHSRPVGYKVGTGRVCDLDTELDYYAVVDGNGVLTYKETRLLSQSSL